MKLDYNYIINLIEYFLGGYDRLLLVLTVFVVVNYITGIMCVIVKRKSSKDIGIQCICKKLIIFLLVGIASILDVEVIGTGSILRTIVIYFYISKEGISILENAEQLGVPIPNKLKTKIKQLSNSGEHNKN